MRRIFPSILSPAAGSPLKEDGFSPSSVSTQDKECVIAGGPTSTPSPGPAPRSKSPSRSRSPFKWGRGSSDTGCRPKNAKSCKSYETLPPAELNSALVAAAKRMSHPGRSADMDFGPVPSRTGNFEDDCVEKQVLTVRESSPTSYFQSAHKLRATMERPSTATSGYDLVVSPQRIYPEESSFTKKAKRYNSAPKLRVPSGDHPKPVAPLPSPRKSTTTTTTQRDRRSSSTSRGSRVEAPLPSPSPSPSAPASKSGTFTAFANLVTRWQSPGKSRNVHGRSMSRGSSDGMSVASNSASNSFRDSGEKLVDDGNHAVVPYKFRKEVDNESRQAKYKSAKSVAEKLAKTLRGSSKGSPNGTTRSLDVVPQMVRVSPNSSTRALKSYFHEEGADECEVPASEIVMEFQPARESSFISYSTSDLKSFAEEARSREVFPLDKRRSSVQDPEELARIDVQLKDYSENFRSMFRRAEERSREAELKLECVRDELESFDLGLADIDDRDEDEVDEVSSNPHRKVKELLEMKVALVREAAAEAKLCVMDHISVKEGWGLMQRRLELAVAASASEKGEMQAALEDELHRREAEWISKLEKVQMEETRLKNRVRDIAESNVGLQKEMASMAAREKGLRDQIRQHEQQLAAHKRKLVEAEKIVLEIRESSVTNRKQNMHTEDELSSVKKAYREKEEENVDLRRLVSRLQQLCTDHEKSIQGLWSGLKTAVDAKPPEREKVRNELLRLSTIEQGLRREVDACNREGAALRRELKGVLEKLEAAKSEEKSSVPEAGRKEIDMKTQTYELEEHNAVLSIKLNAAVREEKLKAEAVKELEERNRALLVERNELQEDIGKVKTQFQDKEKDCKWLETRLQAVTKTNRLLQGIVAKQDALRRKGFDIPTEEAQEMHTEIQRCMEISGEQLTQLNERIELMNDKLLERESELFAAKADCGKKDVTIQSLEQNLGDTKKSLEARIQRLTGRNEELFRLYNAKEKELADMQARLKDETQLRKKRDSEVELNKEQIRELQEELKVQGMHCTLLREKLCDREVELEHQDVETKKSVVDRDVLQKDTKKLQELLDDASQRMIGLEHKLAEKEDMIVWLQRGLSDSLQNVSKAKEELVRTKKDRDLMSKEAEELGREALRASAEVEVLKRRVHRLEEDIMFKDGELSILQNNLDD